MIILTKTFIFYILNILSLFYAFFAKFYAFNENWISLS